MPAAALNAEVPRRLGSGLPPEFARDLAALPGIPSPTAEETRAFVEDVQVILAAAKAGARVHTSERPVRRLCTALGVPLS